MPKYNIETDDGRKFIIESESPEQANADLMKMLGEKTGGNSEGLSAVDVASGFAKNIVPSTFNLIGDVASAVVHPVDTANAVYTLGKGVLAHALPEGVINDDEAKQLASSLGSHYVEKYGSLEGFKKSLATDPASIIADASSILTMGGGALAKSLQVAGKASKLAPISQAAEIAGKVASFGQAIDPVRAAVSPIVGGVKAISRKDIVPSVTGGMTGAGAESIATARMAGRKGGESGAAFLEAMNSSSPNIESLVDDAKRSLDVIKRQKSKEYTQAMQAMGKDLTPLDVTPIQKSMNNSWEAVSFRGKPNPKIQPYIKEVKDIVDDWLSPKNSRLHDAIGLDELKQRIGDLVYNPDLKNKTAKALIERVYNSVKTEIIKQDPTYSATMSKYQKASDQINEITKELGTGGKGSKSSQYKKLMSAMRDNVNTNYSARTDLLKQLESAGGKNLPERLAGESLGNWMPRGLQAAALGPATLSAGGLSAITGSPIPLAISAATTLGSSPRLMGNAAYGMGALERKVGNVGRAVGQILPTDQLAQISKYLGGVGQYLPSADGLLPMALYQAQQVRKQQKDNK
tara:strand:+ start:700 stop:2424 length:1725 start_codon:yes stop_codon:yes gene_type:complete